jgi:hypothetical protein
MSDISRPPRASRQAPYHPAEALSDADPVAQEIAIFGDGSSWHWPPVGSLHDQLATHLRLTKARSEGTAATRDVQAAHLRDRGLR